MALNLSKSFTFTPSTTIASAEVNTDFDTLYNAFSGLESTTSTLAKLKMDADPSAALEVATKQYVDAYANYKRPGLTWISTTLVDVAVNTATANTTKIIFPDGNYRTVTEDTASASKYRRFDITATAEFTSGTEDSGIRSGIAEANNTWYAIYAVKSLINTANFVLAGDTTLPTVANLSTLNFRYNTNGWVYLGMIRNGDNSGVAADILNFIQHGAMTAFRNECTGAVLNSVGTALASTGSASTLTYTYSAGSGSAAIPDNIGIVSYQTSAASSGANFEITAQTSVTIYFHRETDTPVGPHFQINFIAATLGLRNNTSSATAKDIFLISFIDGILGVGSNPFIA